MTRWARGPQPLHRLLGTRLSDLRAQTTETFPQWLERHLRAWSVDPVFQQRVRIREIRRLNPPLQELERDRHAARAAYESSPDYHITEQRHRELVGGENAVSGLAHALARATSENERARLEKSLASYQSTVRSLREELSQLRGTSPEWQMLQVIVERLAQLRMSTGFDEEVARLAELQRSHGRLAGRAGSAFELSAAEAIRDEVIPDLTRRYDAASLRTLRSVRLGSARAEFDYLIVRRSDAMSESVEVVAAIEAKRNLNDLAHGLRHRIDNLRWFTGREGGYDPEAYRTSSFPTGHFDRPATHIEKDGERYVFTRESFAVFAGDPARSAGAVRIPERLYLVSRPGCLWGIGSGGMARIAHRVSSDVEFDLHDPTYLESLLEWSIRLTHSIETPDLLRGFLAHEADTSRMLLLVEE